MVYIQFPLVDHLCVLKVQTLLVSVYFRWFKRSAQSYIKVPILGAISYLTLAVSPFCITFAVVWAVYRDWAYAWIGQDILVKVHFSSS